MIGIYLKFLLILLLLLSFSHSTELKKVSIQFQWKHQFEFAGFYAAVEQGYYVDEGLAVELKEIGNDSDVISQVLNGKSDFGISYSSLVSEYYNGKPVVMMANIFKHSALVLISQKDIVLPSELKGKKVMGSHIALSGTGIGMMLKHFDTDIKDLNIVKNTHTLEPFINKEIDAMTSFITNQPHQLNKQYIQYNILSPTNYGSQFYDVNLFTSRKLYEKDPALIEAFNRASLKGWDYALKHSDNVIKLILKKYNSQNKDFDDLKYEAEIIKSLILPDIYKLGSIDCNVIKKMKKNFIDLGTISANSNFKENKFVINGNCIDSKESQLTPIETSYISNKIDIKVCVDPNWMPFEKLVNGKLIGISSDYLNILHDRLNIPFTIVETKTWQESLTFAKERKCDILSLAMETPSRKKYMNFTVPHLSIPVVIATTTDKLFISDFKDVLDKTFGSVKGYAFNELLRNKYPNLKIVEYNSIEEGLKDVNEGKIYGLIDNLTVLAYHIQKKYISSLKITGRVDQKWEPGIAVRNDDLILLSILNKTISTIQEKEKQNILNQWTSITYEENTNYSFIWKALAILLFLSIFSIYRYLDIKKHNAQLKKLNKKLEKLSTTDGLTQLYNRRYLDSSLKNEYDRAQRYKTNFSLILLDIDDFKAVNDNYGHDKGDDVLKLVSKILVDESRSNDIVGRWGGEEFMIICPNTSNKGVEKVAEKIRLGIQNQDFELNKEITASFGIVEYDEKKELHWHIISVDKALYEAKHLGKNIVKIYTEV